MDSHISLVDVAVGHTSVAVDDAESCKFESERDGLRIHFEILECPALESSIVVGLMLLPGLASLNIPDVALLVYQASSGSESTAVDLRTHRVGLRILRVGLRMQLADLGTHHVGLGILHVGLGMIHCVGLSTRPVDLGTRHVGLAFQELADLGIHLAHAGLDILHVGMGIHCADLSTRRPVDLETRHVGLGIHRLGIHHHVGSGIRHADLVDCS